MGVISRIKNRLLAELFRVLNKSSFGLLGAKSYIIKPLRIDGSRNIYIGNRTSIAEGVWLAALPLTQKKADVRLDIGNDVQIGHFNHIYCTNKIVIEDNVLTAQRVYISDNQHSYEDVTLPIHKQPIKQLCSVMIGAGSWLGEGVCIIGASVGRGCVIGANAVVTKDIPDYSIAVGIPAKVIKRYNANTKVWERVDH